MRLFLSWFNVPLIGVVIYSWYRLPQDGPDMAGHLGGLLVPAEADLVGREFDKHAAVTG